MNDPFVNLASIIFIIFLIGYSINVLFVVYHLLKFGLGYKTKILAIVFSFGSALLIFLNYYLFSKIQWDRYIDILIYRYFDISIYRYF